MITVEIVWGMYDGLTDDQKLRFKRRLLVDSLTLKGTRRQAVRVVGVGIGMSFPVSDEQISRDELLNLKSFMEGMELYD